MENIFNILGIEETKNKEAIRAAYMKRLAVTNPEDNPEGFKELRQAYEEALALADKQEDTSPIGIWIAKVKECYLDLPDRCDRWVWEELLEDEVCTDIGTFSEARNHLLGFIYNNCFLPKDIFLFISDRLNIAKDREELEQEWEGGFIDFILNGGHGIAVETIETEDGISADMACAGWLDYIRADREGNEEGRRKAIEDYLKLNVKMPDFEANMAVEYATAGERDKAYKVLEYLKDKWEDNPFILSRCARAYIELEDREDALRLCDIIEKRYPGNLEYRIVRAKAKELEGDLIGARKIYEELYNINWDMRIFDYLRRVNKRLIQEFTPQTFDEKIDMGWALYQNEDESLPEYVDSFAPTKAEEYAPYYNLKSRALMLAERHEEAIEALRIWRRELDKQECTTDKEVSDRSRRRVLSAFFLARCYRCLADERQDESLRHKALDAVSEILMCDEDKVMLQFYLEKAYTLFELGNLNAAMDMCYIILDKDDGCIPAHLLKQEVGFKQRNPREVLDSFFKVLNMIPDLKLSRPYALASHVFLIYDRYDQALDIVKRADENEVKSDYIDYVRASAIRYTATCKEDTQKSLSILLKIIDKPEEDRVDVDTELLAGIYEETAFAYMDLKQWDKAMEAIDRAIEVDIEENKDSHKRVKLDIYKQSGDMKRALSYVIAMDKEKPDNASTLYEWAALLEREHRKKAVDLYKRVLTLDPDYRDTLLRLKEMFHREYLDKFTKKAYDTALEYAHKAVEKYDSSKAYIARGVLYGDTANLDRAEEDFRQAIELEPDNTVALEWLGDILRLKGRHEEALTYYKSAYEISGDRKGYYPIFDYALGSEAAGEYERAVELYTELTEIYPDEARPLWRLGSVYDKLGNYRQALVTFLKHKERFATSPEAKGDINADILDMMYKLGMEEEAYEMVSADLKKNPNSIRLNLNMAWVYCYFKGDSKNTNKYGDKAVRLASSQGGDDNFWFAYRKRAELLYVLGNGNKLRNMINAAFVKDVNGVMARCILKARRDKRYTRMELYNLAMCEYAEGRIKDALDFFREMEGYAHCINCPYNYCVEALVGKAVLAESEKRYGDAIDCLERVLKEEFDTQLIRRMIERIKEKM